jgi:hypothetical protein
MAEFQFERFQQRWPKILPELESYADAKAQKLLETHLQVRDITQIRKQKKIFQKFSVKCNRPLDLLGVYILLPL